MLSRVRSQVAMERVDQLREVLGVQRHIEAENFAHLTVVSREAVSSNLVSFAVLNYKEWVKILALCIKTYLEAIEVLAHLDMVLVSDLESVVLASLSVLLAELNVFLVLLAEYLLVVNVALAKLQVAVPQVELGLRDLLSTESVPLLAEFIAQRHDLGEQLLVRRIMEGVLLDGSLVDHGLLVEEVAAHLLRLDLPVD